jgi:lysophospholipase L1-like esterase
LRRLALGNEKVLSFDMNRSNPITKRAMTEPAPAGQLTLRRKLVYATACALIALAVGEFGLRARASYYYGTAAPNVPDELSMYDEQSGLRVPRPGAVRRGSKIDIKINSLGFRGDEFSREKPAGTIRIACIGASTTFCAEVTNNDRTWPARLQALLQARHPVVKVQVINAGVGGYVIAESLRNLERRVLPLEPDLVIFYEANNDMALDTRDLARLRGVIGEREGYQSPISKWISSYSLFYDLAAKNLAVLSGGGDNAGHKLTNLPDDLPNRFVSQLEKMHNLLSEHGIPLVLSCFLTKYRRDQSPEVQIANADVAFYYMPWMSIDSLLDGMDLYNEAIVRFSDSRGIPVVTDRQSVPADETHFADFAHFTDAGCDVLAGRFADFLAEKEILEPIVDRVSESQL